MLRSRTYRLTLPALITAAALFWVQAVAPRAPGFATADGSVVGADPGKALAQLYRQDGRVLRVLDRQATPIDLARLFKGVPGWTPAFPEPPASWVIVPTIRPVLRQIFLSADRSSRGPPAARPRA